MSIIQSFATSPKFHPLWRVGWLEKLFFDFCRRTQPQMTTKLFDLVQCGFDVSRYQGVIDFQKMVDYGGKFVIIRAGYGLRKDERFDANMLDATFYLPVSVYHYYDPVANPLQQAYNLIDYLERFQMYIRRVWLDLEFPWDGAYKDPKHWKAYRDTIAAAGYRVGWYTRKTWWDSRVGSFAAEFARDPVWAAQYSSALTLIPAGWALAMLWQSGTPAIGAQVGVSSAEVDFDRWNIDLDFQLEWDGVPTPPAEVTMEKWKVTATSLKVRSGPSTAFGQVQSLFEGDVVEGVFDPASSWINISKITRVNGNTFVPASGVQWWCSGLSAYVEKIVPDPDPLPDTLDFDVDVNVNIAGYVPKTISVSGSLEKL